MEMETPLEAQIVSLVKVRFNSDFDLDNMDIEEICQLVPPVDK